MSNPVVPGSTQDINVQVRALALDQQVTSQYKTKILHKNVVDGVNTLTQLMINDANTKYVIKYDYVLNDDITVPANCVLEFDGGSLSGEYTITCQDTILVYTLNKDDILIDVILAGSFKKRSGSYNDLENKPVIPEVPTNVSAFNNDANYQAITAGDTASRPADVNAGFQYFDTTLGKPIYWNGTTWVDATGTPV